jgi:diadenosine tetraphosphate (Ap4A) HIT family hydrolase
MKNCSLCDLLEKGKPDNLIMENEHAIVTFFDETREGQCIIYTKRHRKKMSEMNLDEFKSVSELILKVSKALEKKYDCEKTYLLYIGDALEHIHFHVIPKHKDLKSLGYYCFGKLWEEEGKRETADSEKKAITKELKEIIDSL